MVMKTKVFLSVVYIVIGVLFFSSCSKNEEEGGSSKSIVGTWVGTITNDTLAYHNSGANLDGTHFGGEPIVCKSAEVWTLTSDNSWIYTHEYYVEKGSEAEEHFGKSGTIVEYVYGEGNMGMYQYTNTDDGGILTLYAPNGSVATYNNEVAVFQCSISNNTIHLVSKNNKKSIQFTRK